MLFFVSPRPILMIYILAQTCIEQIPDTRSACHLAEKSEKFGWKVNAKVVFSEIPTEHLGLRFEVVPSFRSVWTTQNVVVPFILPCVLISRFTYSRLFYKIQTVTPGNDFSPVSLKDRLHATVCWQVHEGGHCSILAFVRVPIRGLKSKSSRVIIPE